MVAENPLPEISQNRSLIFYFRTIRCRYENSSEIFATSNHIFEPPKFHLPLKNRLCQGSRAYTVTALALR
jgi:hypothetical protein